MPTDSQSRTVFRPNGRASYYENRQRSWSESVPWPIPPGQLMSQNSYTDLQNSVAESRPLWIENAQLVSGKWVTSLQSGGGYTTGALLNADPDVSYETYLQAVTSGLENEAMTELLVRAADAKANLPVAYLEASKTSDLIFDNAKRIVLAMRQVKSFQFKKAALTLRLGKVPRNASRQVGFSSNWLAYQYGWMPLVMEVQGAADLVCHNHAMRTERWRVSARKTRNKAVSSSVKTSGGNYTHINVAKHWEVNATARAWCYLQVSNGLAASLQQAGFMNPAAVLWEIVPYSFVFDWFIGVGKYLQASTALSGLTVLSAGKSLGSVQRWRCQKIYNERRTSTNVYGGYDITIQKRKRSYVRARVSSFSVSPALNPDPLGSLTRCLSGLALMRNFARTL